MSDVFTVKCKAMLLTYYLPDMTLPDLLAKLDDQLQGKKYTINKERCPLTDTLHYHLYVHSNKQMEHQITYWTVDGVQPDVSQNFITGSGYAVARDRGHFYVECKFKTGHITQLSNYPWGTCYIVRQSWIEALWRRCKIKSSVMIDALYYYMCATRRMIEIVNLALQYERSQSRKAFIEERNTVLQTQMTSFNVYQELESFKSQFETIKSRYQFLIIQGTSGLGKTHLIKHHYPTAYVHDCAIDWSTYNSCEHEAIIFDDIPEWWNLVFNNKVMFQSNCEKYKVHGSATNCHAIDIELVAKPLIICTNDQSPDNLTHSQINYLNENMIVLHISSKTFLDPSDPSIVV